MRVNWEAIFSIVVPAESHRPTLAGKITSVKKSLVICLCCALVLPMKASAYGAYSNDNPFVEAMLRMMEIFGLIDRDRLPFGVPYLPGYGQYLNPGLGGLGGFPTSPPLAGLGGVAGMSPYSGLGGIPALSGMGTFPGTAAMPGAGGWPYGPAPSLGVPPGSWGNPGYWGYGQSNRVPRHLDGIWELDTGSFVIIQGQTARLYLSRERYQDFTIRYDRRHLWWSPRDGGTASRYRYQMRQGRMILSDDEGNLLRMRRRR